MTRDPYNRRKNIKIVVGVLAVGILMSVLVAVALIYFDQGRPRF